MKNNQLRGRCNMKRGNWDWTRGSKQAVRAASRMPALRALGVVLLGAALTTSTGKAQARVALQPFTQQVRQVETSLAYLGQPVAARDHDAINAAINRAVAESDEPETVALVQEILDQYAIAIVDINPESRVKVQRGAAKAELVEAGTR